jgi:signal transduction histidine kinase
MPHVTVYDVLFLLYNFIQWMMWHETANRLFPPRVPPLWLYAAEIVSCAVAIYLDMYPWDDHLFLRASSTVFFFALPMILLHGGKLLRKIAVAVMVEGSLILSEALLLFISPDMVLRVARRDYACLPVIFYYIEHLICQGLLLVVIYYLFRILERRSNPYLSDREHLIFLLFPISQFVLLAGWYLNYVNNTTPRTLLTVLAVLLFCAATDVLLFRLIGKIAENTKLRARNELMEEQIAARSAHYQIMAQNYSDMRRLRHDLANHLCTIRALLEEGKQEEAQRYARELEQTHTARILLSDCQNSALAAFLSSRIEALAGQQIPVEVDIHLPAACAVSDIDLIIAFGNLLDNAAEACAKTEAPRISIRAALADHYLHIETENPFLAEDCAPKKRRVPYLERGIGSRILQSLAEKYHGTYTAEPVDGMYHATLVLKETAL